MSGLGAKIIGAMYLKSDLTKLTGKLCDSLE
jgi:hypothetical protein